MNAWSRVSLEARVLIRAVRYDPNDVDGKSDDPHGQRLAAAGMGLLLLGGALGTYFAVVGGLGPLVAEASAGGQPPPGRPTVTIVSEAARPARVGMAKAIGTARLPSGTRPRPLRSPSSTPSARPHPTATPTRPDPTPTPTPSPTVSPTADPTASPAGGPPGVHSRTGTPKVLTAS